MLAEFRGARRSRLQNSVRDRTRKSPVLSKWLRNIMSEATWANYLLKLDDEMQIFYQAEKRENIKRVFSLFGKLKMKIRKNKQQLREEEDRKE